MIVGQAGPVLLSRLDSRRSYVSFRSVVEDCDDSCSTATWASCDSDSDSVGSTDNVAPPCSALETLEMHSHHATFATHEWAQCEAFECLRRSLALRQVCDRLLAIPAAHRPRTAEALSRLLRQCKVRTYTVNPVTLAKSVASEETLAAVLGKMPSETHCERVMGPLEQLSETRMAAIVNMWSKLVASGWVYSTACKNPREIASWFIRQAYVQATYPVNEVLDVLLELGLARRDGNMRLDFTCLSADVCKQRLSEIPARLLQPLTLGATTRVVKVRCPNDVVSEFVGKGGENIKYMAAFFRVTLGYKVQMRIHAGCVCTTVLNLGQFDADREDAVVVSDVSKRIYGIREAKVRARKERAAKLLQEGLAYQATLREERESRKQNQRLDRMERSLAGPSSFMEVSDHLWRGRKHRTALGDSRAVTRLQNEFTKRQQHFRRACQTLKHSQRRLRGKAVAEASDADFVADAKAVAQQRVEKLLDSASLTKLCTESRFRLRDQPRPYGQHVAKRAVRLQRDLARAVKASDALAIPVACSQRDEGSQSRARGHRKPARVNADDSHAELASFMRTLRYSECSHCCCCSALV